MTAVLVDGLQARVMPPGRASDPIGVFDSGVGGLSVLRALRAELPMERFVYLADSAHAPYGERDDAYVIHRSQAITRYLVEQQHIKALVVACNTATAVAIKQLRLDFSDLPIVGIEPALKPAAAQSQTKCIGVLATRGTLNSEKFRLLQQSLQGQASFVVQACDGLADSIERNDATKIEAACASFTRAIGRFGINPGELDTLVLGCTHYPFAIETLRVMVGPSIVFLEGGIPVARQTRRLLASGASLAESAPQGDAPSNVTFYATGQSIQLQTAVQRWLDLQVDVQSLDIV